MNILGITDEITTCDCCGKKNLKCTIALETEGGDIVYYGRDCAGHAVYGRKSRKNAELAESRARKVAVMAPVIEAVRNALSRGCVEAVKIGKEVASPITGRYGEKVYVAGYDSWGRINIHHDGEEVNIPLAA